MLNGLDLFSGIGGISLALKDWVCPITYCEIDPYCQAVLLSRMASGDLVHAPIWDDIKTLRFRKCEVNIDIIYGGFPCQGISVAGLRKGLADERSGLFFQIIRLAKEIKPKFIFLENTKGILSNGGFIIIETLASIGYSCRWITKSCKEVGSPQNRERWFCLAYTESERCEEKRQSMRKETAQSRPYSISEYVSWYKGKESPSPFYRENDDISKRMDRVRALGNAVCVEQTKEAFKELMGIENSLNLT